MSGSEAGQREVRSGCRLEALRDGDARDGGERDAGGRESGGGRTSPGGVGGDFGSREASRAPFVTTAPQITLFPLVAPFLLAGLEAGGDKSSSSQVPDLGCRRPGVMWKKGHATAAEVNLC